MNLDELGLMTFPEASIRWNKEATYVRQLYKAHPGKFLKGTTIKIGLGRGTYCITRAGMEHLTGQTEQEASPKWLVRRERNGMINFDKQVDSEAEAKQEIMLLLAKEKKTSTDETYLLEYLDQKKEIFGILLPSQTKLYYKRKQ